MSPCVLNHNLNPLLAFVGGVSTSEENDIPRCVYFVVPRVLAGKVSCDPASCALTVHGVRTGVFGQGNLHSTNALTLFVPHSAFLHSRIRIFLPVLHRRSLRHKRVASRAVATQEGTRPFDYERRARARRGRGSTRSVVRGAVGWLSWVVIELRRNRSSTASTSFGPVNGYLPSTVVLHYTFLTNPGDTKSSRAVMFLGGKRNMIPTARR